MLFVQSWWSLRFSESDIANIKKRLSSRLRHPDGHLSGVASRQRHYRTRIGARQKHTFLNHLLLIISIFYDFFANITWQTVSHRRSVIQINFRRNIKLGWLWRRIQGVIIKRVKKFCRWVAEYSLSWQKTFEIASI